HLIIDARLTGLCVYLERTHMHNRRSQCTRASQKGANAGQQFRLVKRLDQVIVGAAFETAYPRINRSLRGDNENRCLIASGAQLPNEPKAIAIGKTKVDDEQIIAN